VARNRYYTTFAEFRAAVQKVLNNIAAYHDELSSLMTERFQPLLKKREPAAQLWSRFTLLCQWSPTAIRTTHVRK
jgi:hypothetical protein